MTSEEMKNIIIECSGMAGEIEYGRLSKRDFVEWFTNNIQYNGEESKAKGMEVVEILKEEIEWEAKERKYWIHKRSLLMDMYSAHSSAWDMLHNPSRWVIDACFCPENRKSIISEYLEWEDFVKHAKELNIPYYMGIDTFLEKYHDRVYNCLKLD